MVICDFAGFDHGLIVALAFKARKSFFVEEWWGRAPLCAFALRFTKGTFARKRALVLLSRIVRTQFACTMLIQFARWASAMRTQFARVTGVEHARIEAENAYLAES